MIETAMLTKAGGRPVNEDTVRVCEGAGGLLCVLCDGLGGHGGGDVASRLAAEAAQRVFLRGALPAGQLLPLCIAEAQKDLIEGQRAGGPAADMKTTVTLLHLCEGAARWAHVGDSRLYLFRKEKLIARTLDHSVPQMLVNQGELREKDIRFHEDRNRLLRVLGMEWEEPRFELSEETGIKPPASFLLCSDGFWELTDEKEMARALRQSSGPAAWLAAMERKVLQNGEGKNMDNYSAIAVFIRA